MRRLRFLLSMVLCSGLVAGFGLVACGEDDDGVNCSALALKALSCWEDDVPELEDYADFLVMCNNADAACKNCVKNCSLDLPCVAFSLCTDGCPTCPND